MNNRFPSNRTPNNRSFLGVIIQIKQAIESITVFVAETCTRRQVIPVIKHVAENILVGLSSIVFRVKQTEAELNEYIVLDNKLARLRTIKYCDITDVIITADWNTGEQLLSFSVPIQSPQSMLVSGNILLVRDEDESLLPYEIVSVTLSVSDNKMVDVKCNHLYYQLANGQPQTYAAVNQTVQQALARALQHVKWEIGNIDDTIVDLKDLSGSYANPLKMLRQVESEYRCRLKFRATVGDKAVTGLFVDAQEVDNAFSGQRFEFGENLGDIQIHTDYSNVYTAITGLVPGAITDPVTGLPQPLTFAAAEWSKAAGNPADKPLGQTWVGNEDARLLYGIYNPATDTMEHRHGVYDTGAANTPETLLAATWLIGERRHFRPQVTIEAGLSDLQRVKIVDIVTGDNVELKHSKIRVGNVCWVIARHNGLLAAVDARIIRTEQYPKEPHKTRIIIGDAMLYASDYFTELADSLEARDARSRPTDRGPGVAVTMASEDTSLAPQYADIIVPAGAQNFQTYFAQAVAALPADGGQILIMEGNYIFNDDIVINKNKVKVTGQGAATKIKRAATPVGFGAQYGFSAFFKKHIVLQDFELDGNMQNQAQVGGYGIYMIGEATRGAGWGWPRHDPLSNAHTTQDINCGWSFRVQQKIYVDRVRLQVRFAKNYTVRIWVFETGHNPAIVASKTFAISALDQWVEAYLDAPVVLHPLTTYAIVFDPQNAGSGTTTFRGVPNANVTRGEFDPDVYIDPLNGVWGPGPLSYPTSNDIGVWAVDMGIMAMGDGTNENFSLSNLNLINWDSAACYLTHAKDGEIVNCRFNNSKIGLWLDGGLTGTNHNWNIRVLGCEMNNNTDIGLWADLCRDLLVEHNSLVGNGGVGLVLSKVTDSTIIGNTCRQGGDAVAGFVLAGISLLACSRNVISGNSSNQNKYWGISLEGSTANVVTNNACNDSAMEAGIIITGNSLRNTVQGNVCRGNAGFGIRIVAGSNFNQVTNNDLFGNTGGGLSDSGTGTVTAAGNRV